MSEGWKVVIVDDRLPRHEFRICIIRYNLCDITAGRERSSL